MLRIERRAKEFDVIDLASVRPCQSGISESLPNGPCKLRQFFDSIEPQWLIVVADQIEPVAAPRNISRHGTVSRNVNSDCGSMSVRRDVFKRHAPVTVVLKSNGTNRRFQLEMTFSNPTEMGQSSNNTNGAVPAHIQHAHIIKEDDACHMGRINWWTDHRSHHDIRPARLIHHSRPDVIELVPKSLSPLCQTANPQVRSTRHNNSRRFAPGMGINHLKSLNRVHVRRMGKRCF